MFLFYTPMSGNNNYFSIKRTNTTFLHTKRLNEKEIEQTCNCDTIERSVSS